MTRYRLTIRSPQGGDDSSHEFRSLNTAMGKVRELALLGKRVVVQPVLTEEQVCDI